VLAKFILGFFNASYAATATDSLRILVLAALPVVIRVHYVTIHQVKRQIKHAAQTFFWMALLELLLAIIGGKFAGLRGLSIGWVLAMYIEGVWMFSTVFHTTSGIEDSTMKRNTMPAEES
jgi:O-antigen/teichoic acid export membrane protein